MRTDVVTAGETWALFLMKRLNYRQCETFFFKSMSSLKEEYKMNVVLERMSGSGERQPVFACRSEFLHASESFVVPYSSVHHTGKLWANCSKVQILSPLKNHDCFHSAGCTRPLYNVPERDMALFTGLLWHAAEVNEVAAGAYSNKLAINVMADIINRELSHSCQSLLKHLTFTVRWLYNLIISEHHKISPNVVVVRTFQTRASIQV